MARVIAWTMLVTAGWQGIQQVEAAPLDDRIILMTRELDLNVEQQAQVKALLLGQRQQILALWNDTSIPAALRVSRTQVLADHTAGQIRALLSEQQRKKYIQPRKRAVAVGAAGADIDSWASPVKSQ